MNPRSRRARAIAVAVAIVFPTLVTWIYFDLLAGGNPRLQQVAYGFGKLLQFTLPVLWVALALRDPLAHAAIDPGEPRAMSSWKSAVFGILFGLLVCSAMFLIYRDLLPDAAIDPLREEAAERVRRFRVTTWPRYALLGMFYALGHSLLEEYYFRWFVFGQLRRLVRPRWAVSVSALAFMAHHVIVLAHFFDGISAYTIIFSLSIAIGGVVWAWHYERAKSLLGPWISHLLVDVGIFLIGYDLLRHSLG